MSEPIRQHTVPKLYLRNFSFKKKEQDKFYMMDKRSKRICELNINDATVNKNFYTVNKLKNKFAWEEFYANQVESLMGDLLQDIIKKCNSILITNYSKIINWELKKKLSIVIIHQMLRDIHSRNYELKIFKEEAPKILEDAKILFMNSGNTDLDKALDEYMLDEDIFKRSVMDVTLNEDRISKYASVLLNKTWLLFKLTDDSEYITSDSPVVIMDANTSDVTTFRNGLIHSSTVVYYPISSKLILAMYSIDSFFGELNKYDGTVSFISGATEMRFVNKVNEKQLEHCFRQVYAQTKRTLENKNIKKVGGRNVDK